MSATAAASLTSARQAIALPPKPSISLTTLSMASCLRWPLTTTLAPARAKCSAIDLPIFWPEPVTMAVRPASGLAGSTFFSVVTDIVASSITLPDGAPVSRPPSSRRRTPSALRFAEFFAQKSDDGRHDGNHDHAEYECGQVVLDERDVAEIIAAVYEKRNPQHAAAEAVHDEVEVAHAADARHERCERAYYGHEAREDDSLAAVLFVELLRAVQVRGIEQTRALALEHARADEMADPVVRVVAAERRHDQQREERVHVHRAGRRHGTGDEQQGIAGQKRRDHQPGLAKDDQEQDGVNPRAVVLDQQREVLVEMQDQIDKLRKQLHGGSAWPASGRRLNRRADFGLLLGLDQVFARDAEPHHDRAR